MAPKRKGGSAACLVFKMFPNIHPFAQVKFDANTYFTIHGFLADTWVVRHFYARQPSSATFRQELLGLTWAHLNRMSER